ncbi:MAG: hypothetical protein E6Q58_03660 [Niabella sp.]|nr:MAG: hypothetical protein E6Q58_03660 [Niabella sp.]
MKYPKHIYDSLRYEIASSIISHEFKKLFVDLDEKSYESLKAQVFDWPFNPSKYSLTPEPRDFWNGVEGIMTGFRLKGVVQFLTAQNVKWSKVKLDPKTIYFVAQFSVNDKAITMNDKTGEEVLQWLNENSLLEAAKTSFNASFAKGIERHKDPIYGKKDAAGKYYAFDGNGRVMHALLNNIAEIEAYMGELLDDEPRNFWIQTRSVIEMSKLHTLKLLDTENYIKIIKSFFEKSDSTRIEYAERVNDPEELKAKILQN